MSPLQLCGVYLVEMLAAGACTLGSLRPRRVMAALQTEPPDPSSRWPQLQPFTVASRRFGGAASKLCWLVFGLLIGLTAERAGPDAHLEIAKIVAVALVVLLAVTFGAGGARFGMNYSRTLRANPGIGIDAQPTWVTAYGGAVTALAAVMAGVTALAALG